MTHTAVVKTAMTPPGKTVATRSVVSPAKALQEIVQRQLSGRLTVCDPTAPATFWRVYVGNGHVHFATSAFGQKQRLTYLLQQYAPELDLSPLLKGQSDYQLLCDYWQTNQLSLQDVRKLIFQLTQEALMQLLTLPEATLQFERTVGLDPLLLSVPLKQVIVPIRQQINQWIRLRPEINSPFQRPAIANLEEFAQHLWLSNETPQRIQLLSDLLSRHLCLYEVAARLNQDVLQIATLLQPLVQTGAVTIQNYRSSEDDTRPVIACVDDSRAVQRNVRLTLETCGYRVLELMEPARALTALVRHKPALVLMDITMPEVDGYELCRMLRQSNLLREVPIVMLTGRDGLIDRLRARMVGATDYMTKPFEPQQLLALVNRLTSYSQVEVG